MAVLGWLGIQGMFFLHASLPCWTASGVRGEQAEMEGRVSQGPALRNSRAPLLLQ